MSTLSDLSRINLKIFHSFIFHSFSRGRGGKVNDTIFTLFGFFFILTSSLYHCLYYQRHCGPESYDSPQTGQHPAQHQAGSGHGTNSLVDGPLNKMNIIETNTDFPAALLSRSQIHSFIHMHLLYSSSCKWHHILKQDELDTSDLSLVVFVIKTSLKA